MTYSRICTRAAGLSVALALACAATLPAAEAGPSYDGLWSVVIVTKTGQCDAAYRYPVRITNGSLVNGGSAPPKTSRTAPHNRAGPAHVNPGAHEAGRKGRPAPANRARASTSSATG